jgi:hypothetical protein
MDGNPLSGIYELIKNLFGAGIILYTGDWFGISQIYPWALPVVVGYLLLSTLVTGVLAWKQYKHAIGKTALVPIEN